MSPSKPTIGMSGTCPRQRKAGAALASLPVDEASEYYADHGLGRPASRIDYADPCGPV